jgi:hypothetical protein
MELQIENTCQNCNREIAENFCGNCGQKKFKRIDRKYISDELQYTVVHWNKGLLYTIKKLIKNPGQTARTFVEGDRVNHYKPISMVFILSGLGTFLSFKVFGFSEVMKEQMVMAGNKSMNAGFANNYLSFVTNYSAFIMLALIPIIAFFTKLVFRKWGHNYYEHIVMNAYGLSLYSVLSMLVIYPILFLVKNDVHTFSLITNTSIILTPLIMIWFFKGFYPEKKLTTIILRVLLMVLLFALSFIIIIFSVTVVYMILNPDGAKALFQPK